jgi:hypothetical protein
MSERNKGGRPKGSPNKLTADVRACFAALLRNQMPKVDALLDRIAETDPKGAVEILLKVSERFVPKLSSVEVTGEGGGPVTVVLRRGFSQQQDALPAAQQVWPVTTTDSTLS